MVEMLSADDADIADIDTTVDAVAVVSV